MKNPRIIPPHEIVGVIPARWGSTRFPGKMLADLQGRTLIEWVVRGCMKSRRVRRWIVATDDKRIATVAERTGAAAVMTSSRLRSGSDRVAKAVASLSVRWVVNWQGDEWLPDGRPIDALVGALEAHPDCEVATLARPLPPADADNPHRVKVVVSPSGHALYFSRAAIPHDSGAKGPLMLHLGAYIYSKTMLLRFAGWPQTPLEKREKLEQLRLLEHDVPVAVGMCRVRTFGVDTAGDLKTVQRHLAGRR